MSRLFDIAVIGGGPAGCSAAITAARGGARVALLEMGSFPRQKVCGEFVSAESLGLLRALLGDDRLFSSAPMLHSACFHMDGRSWPLTLPAPGASITRWDLDSALWDAARASGVSLFESVEAESIANGSGYRIHSSGGEFAARSVIQAAGRRSRLRQVETSPGPKWIGLKAHYYESKPHLCSDLYFFSGGYCGVQPVAESEVNVCAMVRADVAHSLEEVFFQHLSLELRSRDWQMNGSPCATAPLEFRAPRPADGNILLAGDAAGFIDPFVGDGISMALQSGAMAARAILKSGLESNRAAAAYASEYDSRLAPAFRGSARVRRLLSLPRAARALALSVASLSPVSRWLFQATRPR